MTSISHTSPQTQGSCITSYRYALNTTPNRMQTMSREELLQCCIEQYLLLTLIIKIIYNSQAAITSRLVAIDLIIQHTLKVVRGKLSSLTDRSPTYLPKVGERLGMHENTVSKSYNSLEKYRTIERHYRPDETTLRQHLDLNITPLLLTQPDVLRDKTQRSSTTTLPGPKTPAATQITCPSCGTPNVLLTCKECGAVEDLSPPPVETTLATTTSDHDPQRHKICGDETSNIPPDEGMLPDSLQETAEALYHQEKEGVQPPGSASPIPSQRRFGDGMIGKDSTPPLPGSDPGMSAEPTDPEPLLISWLQQRQGQGQLIFSTGKQQQDQKYLTKPLSYQPHVQAYLAGDRNHIYGSRLRLPDGTTFVLAFDLDQPEEDAAHSDFLTALARGGASPLYWQHQNHKGHLELYFDTPVDPVKAYQWCLQVCPALAKIEECYPVPAGCAHLAVPPQAEGEEPTIHLCPAIDRSNNPISWPLYQRIRNVVLPCSVVAAFAVQPGQVITYPGIAQDKRGLADLIAKALTPASLFTAMPGLQNKTSIQEAEAISSQVEKKPHEPSDADLAKTVIAEFNQTHTWDEVAVLCGGLQKDRFCAVWRGEKSPSVVIDRGGEFAADYGRRGPHDPFKLDRYEVWCLAQGGREFKRFDLAQRISVYREQLKRREPAAPPVDGEDEAVGENAPPLVPTASAAVAKNREETTDEIVARLNQAWRQKRKVLTPKGKGKLWRVWDTQIGVVLDTDPGRVQFFTALSDMRAIVALDEPSE